MARSISSSFASNGFVGTAIPNLSLGIGLGISLWAKAQVVNTVDAGFLGAGKGILPFLIPAPLLLSNLMTAYSSKGIVGEMAPQEANSIATGLSVGLAQGSIESVHPTVGTGGGTGIVSGPSAFSFLMQGFSSNGILGEFAPKKASAISTALMVTLQSFTFLIPIVGSGSSSAGSGVGSGVLV
jgi:hypothetical protein